MAIAPGIVQFVNTTCVEKALAEEWDGELTSKLDGSIARQAAVIISVASLGLMAPLFYEKGSVAESNQEQIEVSYAYFSLHNTFVIS